MFVWVSCLRLIRDSPKGLKSITPVCNEIDVFNK